MLKDDTLLDEAPHVMLITVPDKDAIHEIMQKSAVTAINKAKATHEIYAVPSCMDIPAAIKYAIRGLDFYTARRRFDAYVVLGCMYESRPSAAFMLRESVRALQDMTVEHTLAMGKGLILCHDKEEALKLAGTDEDDMGGKAARDALEMIKLKSKFGIYPRL